MAKTIGDLTLKEIKTIKDRCGNYKNCSECKEKDKLGYKVCNIEILGLYDDTLDQEIEVEE